MVMYALTYLRDNQTCQARYYDHAYEDSMLFTKYTGMFKLSSVSILHTWRLV
jgi:hypothetical protein